MPIYKIDHVLPDDGPPRLFRFYDGAENVPWAEHDLVAVLDKQQNVLHIDRREFDKLTQFGQHQVMYTGDPYVTVGEFY